MFFTSRTAVTSSSSVGFFELRRYTVGLMLKSSLTSVNTAPPCVVKWHTSIGHTNRVEMAWLSSSSVSTLNQSPAVGGSGLGENSGLGGDFDWLHLDRTQ